MAYTKGHDDLQNSGTSSYDVLPQTIIQSPRILWMLPAKLRDQHHMDIVIVRDFSISLEQFRDNHLLELSARVDFDSRILSAKVLETSSESFVDTILRQHRSDSTPVKNCPPNVLVLCLASQYLLFVTVEANEAGTLAFVYSRRPLPSYKSESQRFGRHLAINSQSRVLACSAAYRHFGLFALRNAAAEYDVDKSGPQRLPQLVREERFFLVDGNILEMNFIRSLGDSSDLVQLILLVSKSTETYAVVYTWNSQGSLVRVSLDENYPAALPRTDRMPRHLIPLKRPMSFILVLDDGIALYSMKPKGHWDRDWHPFQDEHAFARASHPQRDSWVQWARPMRNEERQKNNDDFYLCHSDGLMRYIELQVKPDLRIDVRFDIGRLIDCRVGTGFAVLSGDYEYGAGGRRVDDTGSDVVIFAGDRSQGGVYNVGARENPECIQIIPNWAPIRDLLRLDSSGVDSSSECSTSMLNDRLFVCGGRAGSYANEEPVGTVSELRYGFEAQIRHRVPQPGSCSVTGLWALEDVRHQRIIFLMSLPEQTTASMAYFPSPDKDSRLPYNLAQFYDADEGTAYGMKADSETLDAGCLSENLAVQVTPKGICVLNFDSQSDGDFHSIDSTSSIVAATINEELGLIITCFQNTNGFALVLSRVEPSGAIVHQYEPMSLPKQPTALCARDINGELVLAIGDGDGGIAIFRADSRQRLFPQAEYSVNMVCPDPISLAINSIALLDSLQTSSPIALCGLRNGWLVYLVLEVSESKIEGQEPILQMKAQQRLGRTSICLTLDTTNHHNCFVMCEGNAFLFQRTFGKRGDPNYRLHPIFLSDHKAERLRKKAQCKQKQHTFHAVARLPKLLAVRVRDLVQSVGCVLDNELVFCQLSLSPKAVPRTIFLTGDPTLMAYSKRLRKIIAAVETSARQRGQPHTETGFEVIDPDDSSITYTMTGAPPIQEAVSQIMIWRPMIGGNEYEMMVVTTNCDREGRLEFYKIIPGSKPEIKLSQKWPFRGKKIHRIASYGQSAIIICIENKLVLKALKLPGRQWETICEHELPSPAIAITVTATEQIIYVTTSRHSLHILIVKDDKFKLLESSLGSLDALNQIQTGSGIMITGTSRHGDGHLVGYGQPSPSALAQDESAFSDSKNITQQFEGKVATPICHFGLGTRTRGDQNHSEERFYGASMDGTVYQLKIVQKEVE